MTYKEAMQVQLDNWDILNHQMVDSNPPHLVLGSIIAPAGSTATTLGFIYNKITDEHILNDELLLDNNMWNNDLIVYVVYKMKGAHWFQPLELYLIKPFLIP